MEKTQPPSHEPAVPITIPSMNIGKIWAGRSATPMTYTRRLKLYCYEKMASILRRWATYDRTAPGQVETMLTIGGVTGVAAVVTFLVAGVLKITAGGARPIVRAIGKARRYTSEARREYHSQVVGAGRAAAQFSAGNVPLAAGAIEKGASWVQEKIDAPLETQEKVSEVALNFFERAAEILGIVAEQPMEFAKTLAKKSWEILNNPGALAEKEMAIALTFGAAAWKIRNQDRKTRQSITPCTDAELETFLKMSAPSQEAYFKQVNDSGLWYMKMTEAAQFHTAIHAWSQRTHLNETELKTVKETLRALFSIHKAVCRPTLPKTPPKKEDIEKLNQAIEKFKKLTPKEQNDILFRVSVCTKDEGKIQQFEEELKKLQTNQETTPYDPKVIENLVAESLEIPHWVDNYIITPQIFNSLDITEKARIAGIVKAKANLTKAELERVRGVKSFFHGKPMKPSEDKDEEPAPPTSDIMLTLRRFNQLPVAERQKLYDLSKKEIGLLTTEYKLQFLKQIQLLEVTDPVNPDQKMKLKELCDREISKIHERDKKVERQRLRDMLFSNDISPLTTDEGSKDLKALVAFLNDILSVEEKQALRGTLDVITGKFLETAKELDKQIADLEDKLAKGDVPDDEKETEENRLELLKAARELQTGGMEADYSKLASKDLTMQGYDTVLASLKPIDEAIGRSIVSSGYLYRAGQLGGYVVGYPTEYSIYLASLLPKLAGKIAGTTGGQIAVSIIVHGLANIWKKSIQTAAGKKRIVEALQSAGEKVGLDIQAIEQGIVQAPLRALDLLQWSQEALWNGYNGVKQFISDAEKIQKAQQKVAQTGGVEGAEKSLEAQRQRQMEQYARTSAVVYGKTQQLSGLEDMCVVEGAQTLMANVESQRTWGETLTGWAFGERDETQRKRAAVGMLSDEERVTREFENRLINVQEAQAQLERTSWFTNMLASHLPSFDSIPRGISGAISVAELMWGTEIGLCKVGLWGFNTYEDIHATVERAVDKGESYMAGLGGKAAEGLANLLGGGEGSGISRMVANELGKNIAHALASYIPGVTSMLTCAHPLTYAFLQDTAPRLIDELADWTTKNFDRGLLSIAKGMSEGGRYANIAIMHGLAGAGKLLQRGTNYLGQWLSKKSNKGYWIDEQRILGYGKLSPEQKDHIFQLVKECSQFTSQELEEFEALRKDLNSSTDKTKERMYITTLLLAYDSIEAKDIKILTEALFAALPETMRRRIFKVVKQETAITPRSAKHLVDLFNNLDETQKKKVDTPSLDEFQAIPEERQKETLFQILHSKAYRNLGAHSPLCLTPEEFDSAINPECPLPPGKKVEQLLTLYKDLSPAEHEGLTPAQLEKFSPSRLVRMYEYIEDHAAQSLHERLQFLGLEMKKTVGTEKMEGATKTLLVSDEEELSIDDQVKRRRLILELAHQYSLLDLSLDQKKEVLQLSKKSIKVMNVQECLSYIEEIISQCPDNAGLREKLTNLAITVRENKNPEKVATDLAEIFKKLTLEQQVKVHEKAAINHRVSYCLRFSSQEQLKRLDEAIMDESRERDALKEKIDKANTLFVIATNTKAPLANRPKLESNLRELQGLLAYKERSIRNLFRDRKMLEDLYRGASGKTPPPPPAVTYTHVPDQLAINMCEVIFHDLEKKLREQETVEELNTMFGSVMGEVRKLKDAVDKQNAENAPDFAKLLMEGEKRLQILKNCRENELNKQPIILSEKPETRTLLEEELKNTKEAFNGQKDLASLNKAVKLKHQELTSRALSQPDQADDIERLRHSVDVAYTQKKRESFTPTHVLINEWFSKVGRSIKRTWNRFVSLFKQAPMKAEAYKGESARASVEQRKRKVTQLPSESQKTNLSKQEK